MQQEPDFGQWLVEELEASRKAGLDPFSVPRLRVEPYEIRKARMIAEYRAKYPKKQQ